MRYSDILILISIFLIGQINALCGGTTGSCCITSCPNGCLNTLGQQMCKACDGNCDYSVCPCGCNTEGLKCGNDQTETGSSSIWTHQGLQLLASAGSAFALMA